MKRGDVGTIIKARKRASDTRELNAAYESQRILRGITLRNRLSYRLAVGYYRSSLHRLASSSRFPSGFHVSW